MRPSGRASCSSSKTACMATRGFGCCGTKSKPSSRRKAGKDHLQKKKLQKELADLNKEARKLKTRLKAIERRRAELMKELDG